MKSKDLNLTPAHLDRIVSDDAWICPKCQSGMDYTPMYSSAMYVCSKCHWMQHETPKRSRLEKK